jgi:hypothetical protein
MDRTELLVILANVAELRRGARGAGVTPHPSSPMVCPPERYARWGAGRTCTLCGGPMLHAASFHRHLTAAPSVDVHAAPATRAA